MVSSLLLFDNFNFLIIYYFILQEIGVKVKKKKKNTQKVVYMYDVFMLNSDLDSSLLFYSS